MNYNLRLKKIHVTDQCVACGICTRTTDLLVETVLGTAMPKDSGLIKDEEIENLMKVADACPVKAIKIIDEEVTKLEDSESLIKLKELMNNLLNEKLFIRPKFKDLCINFVDNDTPLTVSNTVSKIRYSSESKVRKEAKEVFRTSVYSQRDAMVQALLINYKTFILNNYIRYEENEGNYFYDNNNLASKHLKEIISLAQAIACDKLNIPQDFYKFDVRPSGQSSSLLNNMENLEVKLSKERSYFEEIINIEYASGGYVYNIESAVDLFKKFTVFDVFDALFKNREELFAEIDSYIDLCQKSFNKKLIFIKEELRKFYNVNDGLKSEESNIKDKINNLIKEFSNDSLNVEKPYRMIDFDYDSSFRFSSSYQCKECAGNRRLRYYRESLQYLSQDISDNISCDFGKLYEKQINERFNKFINQLHAVFDKYKVVYPKVKIRVRTLGYSTLVDLNSFEEINLQFSDIIKAFVDSNILGWGNKVDPLDYFEETDVTIDIMDSIEFKTGLFGRTVEKPVYAYILNFREFDDKFEKACEACANCLEFLSYVNKVFNDLKKSFLEELNYKVVKKL